MEIFANEDNDGVIISFDENQEHQCYFPDSEIEIESIDNIENLVIIRDGIAIAYFSSVSFDYKLNYLTLKTTQS